uniref:Uncharacterized protein n=1 Tax=Kalanchoe fedtschenkoi TaxID=63787 RepID=A0A7N0TK73_KALFE
MTSHTSKRSGSVNGSTRFAIVISGDALGKNIDTQLVDQQKDESFGGISPGFDQKDESFGGVSAGSDQKDESFGGVSPGSDQKDVTDIIYKNHGLSECYDVLLTDEIGEGVMACSSYQSLFDHEVFSFELPEVCDLINPGKNGVEYHQQHQWQWQLPSTSDIVGKEMRWEDQFHDSLCVTDFLTMDVPQFSK